MIVGWEISEVDEGEDLGKGSGFFLGVIVEV
jgi:hypothetical protein